MTDEHGPRRHFPVVVPVPSSQTASQGALPDLLYVTPTDDGIARGRERGSLTGDLTRQPELVQALKLRGQVSGAFETLLDIRGSIAPETVDRFASGVLVVPRSERWREAVTTASLGSWCEPFFDTGHLSATALGALKAEARAVHRQLVPVWRRRTRHGRVLSLDADLGGLSLYDLVAADVDLLAHTTGGVFDDERLNTVLRGLNPAERAVVFAYAESDARTWAEAATAAGANEPEAFGERVRRKTRRLAAEHTRRMAQRRRGKALPVGGPSLPLTMKGAAR
ncbi:hypothetical protein ACSNOJ_11240 [Streptomyces sp. URMC 128]|uniref:hypothetical protein n=1 Tax=Streptomyces sp. URMC 128 TaxID=3423404 RepID=UPI003F1A715F